MPKNKSAKKDEIYSNALFKKILKQVVIPITGDTTTYLSELERVGNKLLGTNFKGVFASDRIPRLNELKKYCILNLDKTGEPGSHWVAIAKDGKKTWVYDSFGRSHVKIIKGLKYSGNGRIVEPQRDAEQSIEETNCGALSLAWLVLHDGWGSRYSKWI